ncbi:MAG: metallophosphoesterase, partial [Methylobacter sp.]
KYRGAIWHDEFEMLKALKADILVTHEAPGSHRHGFDVIGELAAAMGVKHIFHGHLHENYTGIVKNKIKVFGVADRAVANLLGNTLSGGS